MSMDEALVCDLSAARDSVEERLAAYREVFAALLGRELRDRQLRFRFRAEHVDVALLGDLVERERACCPFLHSSLRTVGSEVWWDCRVDSAEAVPFLQALHDLPDPATSPAEGILAHQPFRK